MWPPLIEVRMLALVAVVLSLSPWAFQAGGRGARVRKREEEAGGGSGSAVGGDEWRADTASFGASRCPVP